MTLSGPAFFSVIFIIALAFLVLGVYIGAEVPGKWQHCEESLPPDTGRTIVNYPVAFFDEEFGVVIDQAEYHPNRAEQWLTVSEGTPCKPFAWYDLPLAPHPRVPQDIPRRRAVDDYI